MDKEVIHVEVTRMDGREEPRGPRWTNRATVVLLCVMVVLTVFFPPLGILVILAAVLAAASFAKASRRQAVWEERFGVTGAGVGVVSYLRYLAAWFYGLFAVVPFVLLVVVGASIGIVVIILVAILALVVNLFSSE